MNKELRALGVTDGLWKTSPVDAVPEIVLRSWRVVELEDGDRHFVGYNITGSEGRVSSKIMTFDAEKMCGITHSGRVYQLEGPFGYNSDAMYVWDRWMWINGVGEGTYKDVSESL